MDELTIEEKKEGESQIDSSHSKEPNETVGKAEDSGVGPIMGLYAVCPINECPHCVLGEGITSIEEFKDV